MQQFYIVADSVTREAAILAHKNDTMFTKLDKEFILSDSSINKYGMRLMTSGYQVNEFAKNPIGYYMHKTDDGVLCRWEDVRLDGDEVVGKPVINMEHPRAERTVKEINEGFLNGASVGKLAILEYHLDDNPEDAENPIIVVTKWYNKECSLVDRPGNRNAFAKEIELCDGEDNELVLSEIINNYKKANNMIKKVTIELNPTVMGLLKLSDDKTTAEAVIEGIQGLSDENDKLTTSNAKLTKDLAADRERVAAEKIDSVIATGLSEGRLTKAAGDKLKTQFAGKPKELEELISDLPKYQSLTDRLVDGELPKELSDKSYDELHQAGKIGELKDKFPVKYKSLYKAKFGVEPK